MKTTITLVAAIVAVTAGCQNPTAPTQVQATVEPITQHEQLVVATEEISPGVWTDIGVLRVCDAPTSYYHNGTRIMQIVISADLPCPR